MKRTIILISAFIICHLSLSVAQTQTTPYQPGVTPDGATYFLPKTAISVTLLVEKTTVTPGDFCKYAERYLRLKDVPQEPSTRYQVIGVTMSPVGVRDAKKGFSVKYNARTSACNVSLSADGLLLAVNAEPAALPQPTPFVSAPRAALLNPRDFMSEEILAAGSTAKMAQLTAQEIYDLRENHSLLIKGQADFMPKDGEQLRLMLTQLDAQNQALTALFSGITQRDTTEHTVVYCPDAVADRHLLFRFSERMGLVDDDDLAGTPYYIKIEDLHTVPSADEVAAAKKKLNPNGVYVNVPGRMRATLLHGVLPVAVEEMPAPQFGHVELLSGDLFNKRTTTHLTLSPLTGAVERLEAELPKK